LIFLLGLFPIESFSGVFYLALFRLSSPFWVTLETHGLLPLSWSDLFALGWTIIAFDDDPLGSLVRQKDAESPDSVKMARSEFVVAVGNQSLGCEKIRVGS
jgi:hypothetical protein